MRRALALFVVLALVGLFALLNWTTFVTPTPLSLGVTTVDAPLGLVMLGVVVFLTLLYVVWAVSMQAGSIAETRRLTKDLNAQRELADKAEASRFTELRSYLALELQNIAAANDQARAALLAQLERLNDAQRVAQEESANTLIAHLGELEDRLERAAVVAPSYERGDSPLLR